MGFLYYFYITAFVLLTLLVVYELILIAVNSQRIKKISQKATVKKSIGLNIIWICLSASNVFTSLSQYTMQHGINDKRAQIYFLVFLSWTICGIAHIIMIFLDKHIYITPDGVFFKSALKIKPKEKYRYRIEGDTLELWYRQNDNPAKYRIESNNEELCRMLDENYIKYTGESD